MCAALLNSFKKERTKSHGPHGEEETVLSFKYLVKRHFHEGRVWQAEEKAKNVLQSSRGVERLLSKEQGAEPRLELFSFLCSKRGPHRGLATQKAPQWTEITTRRDQTTKFLWAGGKLFINLFLLLCSSPSHWTVFVQNTNCSSVRAS